MADTARQPKTSFLFKLPQPFHSPLEQYGVAILSVLVAVLLGMALTPLLHSKGPFLTMFPAVFVAAWLGGWRPGILSVALGTLASWYFFMSPEFTHSPMDLSNELTMGVFVLNGIGLSAIAEAQRRDLAERREAEAKLRESEQHLKLAIAASNLTLYSQDASLHYTWLYNTVEGYTPESLVGKRDQDLMPDEDAGRLTAIKQQVIQEGKGTRREVPLTVDGAEKVFDLVIEPIRDEQGNVTGVIGTSGDVTERTRAQTQQQFLFEAGFLLASSLDYHITLHRVAKLAVPHFADWCVVDMLDENGVLQRLVAAHVDANKEEMIREVHERFPPPSNAPAGPYHVVRTGLPEMLSDIPDPLLRATARSEEHYHILKAGGLKSYICVPLIAREQVMGVITLVQAASGRRYGVGDLELAQELARRASLAVDNARLYQAAQQEIARRTEAEQALLQNKIQIEALNARLSRSMAETHHRVKNNLQVITALAELQTMQGQESVPVAAMDRIRMHVRALAGIHDLLTKAARSDADTDVISVRDTLKKLLSTLEGVIGVRSIHADVQQAALPTRQAGALTILVNEIISNAVKHGGGDIELKFSVENEQGRLEISDSGPGFPPDFDPQKSANTGLDLIESMACWDLRGDIAYTNKSAGGAEVVVTFPLPSSLYPATELT